MTEPVTTIAIAATIIFCLNPSIPVKDDNCAGEGPAQKQVVNLLVSGENTNDIVEIETNGKRVYTLRADGTVIKSTDFNDDQAAKNFWMSLNRAAPSMWQLPRIDK